MGVGNRSPGDTDDGVEAGGSADYDRLLALHTAMRMRRAIHAGRHPSEVTPLPRTRKSQEDEPVGPRDGDQRLLKESIDIVAPEAADLVTYFYALLFHGRPYLRELFPIAMDTQRDRLLHALLAVVGRLDEPGLLVPLLEQLGRDHRKFGVRPVHYGPVGAALVASLKHFSGSAWQPEFEEAWLRAYMFAVETMTGAASAAEPTPPYWHATVVDHDLRRTDLAVLLLRPDSPYHYVAGQFATLESPMRPRTWRPYSMANAPSRDGLLEFHVRRVGAGWVSRALVRSTSVGDVLRLGPPIGSMTLQAAEPGRDLLLIGGGTGLAPMKAMLQSMSTVDPRRVTLLVAARSLADTYDLEAMCALVTQRRSVTLLVATAHKEEYDVPLALPSAVTALLPGRAADLLGQLGDLREREVFLAGPPAMLQGCLAGLTDLGLPGERLHYDVIAE